MNYGGPVWHASVAPIPGAMVPQETLYEVCLNALRGVGDAARGEWREVGIRAMHLRRRVSAAEEATIGPAVDIRGTPEQMQRFRRVQVYLPSGMQEPL